MEDAGITLVVSYTTSPDLAFHWARCVEQQVLGTGEQVDGGQGEFELARCSW